MIDDFLHKKTIILNPLKIINLLRILFGLLFIFSGLMKFYNLNEFHESIIAFAIVPSEFSQVIVYVIPLFEIVMGSFITLGIYQNVALQITVPMLVLFTSIVFVKVIEGANINCGCFGALSSERIDLSTIIRNLILIFLGVSIHYFIMKEISIASAKNRIKSEIKSNLVLFIFAFLIFQNLSFASMNIKLKDQISNLMQKDILNEGDIVKPFSVYNSNGTYSEINFQHYSYTVLFIMRYGCELCKENIPYWNMIAHQTKNLDIQVFGVAYNQLDLTEKLKVDYMPKFKMYANYTKEFKKNFKLILTPIALIISRSGKIEKFFKGTLDKSTANSIINYLHNKI